MLRVLQSLVNPRLQHLWAHIEYCAAGLLRTAPQLSLDCHLSTLLALAIPRRLRAQSATTSSAAASSSHCRAIISTTLTRQILAQFLCDDGDVEESLERTSSGIALDLGQLEGGA